jgi:tRNA A-37 threonylcarbamoyl transferase component Bud32
VAIESGQQLLHYRLIEKIGEGGMGVVWKARDTTLDRDVAIKVLPQALAEDPERLARFEREAKLLAALNHPGIASVYGLHFHDSVRFLAMEFVPGEDLARRLARGPLPIDDALSIAREIAEALESAHANGIVHRDLKPANVVLTPDGKAKVLDFGLAKALAAESASGASDPSLSPTLTSVGTVAGMIMGTAGYMAPEQAKGRPVDRRADVWSLGALLYEMLSSRRAFDGDSASEALASVLKTEPDWDALPPQVPASVRRLLRRCLKKNPHDRLHDAADARIVLTEVLASEHDEPPANFVQSASKASWWPTAAALAVAALAIGYAAFKTPGAESVKPATVSLQVRAGMLDFSTGALPFALSPDGMTLAYVDYDGAAKKLFIRRMDSFDVQSVDGTEGAGAPFFSPEGERIGFFAHGQLKKVALAGGRPVAICPVAHAPGGAVWLEDDTIVYSMAFTPTGLYRVAADGGDSEVLTTPDGRAGEFTHQDPDVLPGGRAIVFMISSTSGMEAAVLDLDTLEHSPLRDVKGRVRSMPDGRLLYGDAKRLLAVPFDARAGGTSGPPVAVLEDVGIFMGGTSFTVSRSGALAFVPDAPIEHVWVDRDGRITPLDLDDTTGGRPILSHDGSRLAIAGGTGLRGQDLLIYDLVRGGRTRLPGFSHMQWSPDDSSVYTILRPKGVADLFRLRADGSREPELVFEDPNPSVLTGLSPDDDWLLFYEQHPETSRNVWVVRLDGSGDAFPLVATAANERSATFSPDGRWFAYTSNASGRDEVYVRRFDPSGAVTEESLVSIDGGREPHWSRDGKELFYRVGRLMMIVDVDLRDGFRAGEPQKLFEGSWEVETGGQNQMYDVTPDGRRFVMVRTAEASNTIHVVLNWGAESAGRSAANR